MSNPTWSRGEHIEEVYDAMYGIKPEIYVMRVNGHTIQTKLKLAGKTVILTEILERGLTKEAIMEYNGIRQSFKRTTESEQAANEVLKG